MALPERLIYLHWRCFNFRIELDDLDVVEDKDIILVLLRASDILDDLRALLSGLRARLNRLWESLELRLWLFQPRFLVEQKTFLIRHALVNFVSKAHQLAMHRIYWHQRLSLALLLMKVKRIERVCALMLGRLEVFGLVAKP